MGRIVDRDRRIDMDKSSILSFYSHGGARVALDGLEMIMTDMETMGYRQRTIDDYSYHFERYCRTQGIVYLHEMDRENLMKYLALNNVKDTTRQIRLKAVRAVLNKMLDRKLIDDKFWNGIRVRTEHEFKEGITEKELTELLGELDFTDYVQYRDACTFALIWETGVRIGTVAKLTKGMIDFDEKLIHFSGETMKNRIPLTMPISPMLVKMMVHLIRWSDEVRGNITDRVFTSSTKPDSDYTHVFSLRVVRYKKLYGLKNINPHAIRRGFAKRLLDQGVNIAMISRALNHQSLDTTTRYLNISDEELIDRLRV